MNHCLVLSALLVTLPALRSQEIRLFGELVQQGGQLHLATPDVRLLPGNTGLASEVGHFVEVRGTLVGSATPPKVLATFAARADHTFELNGGLRLGHVSQLRIDSTTAYYYYVVASLAPGFLPLTGIPFASGTVFVALPTTVTHAGPISSSWQGPFAVPSDSALLGLELWFQGAIFDGTFVYINAQRAAVTT